jgi:Tol biopolymer transport system component
MNQTFLLRGTGDETKFEDGSLKNMKALKTTTTLIVAIIVCFCVAQLFAQPTTPTPTTSPNDNAALASPSATPPAKPLQLISYLKDGGLWLMKEDGSENRQVVPAPENAAIANALWTQDGSRIYFNVDLNLHAYVVMEQKVENLGRLQVPTGFALDRVELSSDAKTLLAQLIDTNDALNSVPKIYAVTLNPMAARELTVDEYRTLAPSQSATIAKVGDLSVSPDGRFVLFAEATAQDMQLFVADIETGNRHQVTDLSLLDGFEPSAMPDGSRRVIEATWSPDGQHIVFVPAQSCSEFGLCSGKMFLVDAWGGAQLQLATAMTTNLSQEWNHEKNLLVYDDNGQVVISDTQGQLKALAEGTQPKWQPRGQVESKL